MENFKHPTYIVMDLPDQVKRKVMMVREEHHDTFRMALPVEITLVGSSGAGVISSGQDEETVFRIIDEIAKQTKPMTLSFKGVERFPGSDFFVLKLSDETNVRALHEQFLKSGIAFDETKHAFNPHCTLRTKSPISDEEVEKIMKVTISEPFIVDTLSVYTLEKLPIIKIHTTKLIG